MNESTPVHDNNGNTVPLKHYIERILEERQRALEVLAAGMERRLDNLNELRQDVEKDRGQFLRLDVYDEKHEALEKAVLELERTLTKAIRDGISANSHRIDNLEAWRLKAVGAALILIPLAGLIGAAIMKAFGS